MMDFKEVFKDEFNMISTDIFRETCINMIEELPQYILEQPSSTTGKYHPADEVGVGTECLGMIKHIKRCAIVADEFARKEQLSVEDRDILIAGCIMHDWLKMGTDEKPLKWTNKLHPLWIYQYITKWHEEKFIPVSQSDVEKIDDMLYRLAMVCLYHEGQWTDVECKVVEKRRNHTGRLCDIMHDIDYVASRRSFYDMMQPGYFDGKL